MEPSTASVATNGKVEPISTLDPRPGTSGVRWMCGGFRKDGVKCHTILAEMRLAPQSVVTIRCPKCGTWNVWEKE